MAAIALHTLIVLADFPRPRAVLADRARRTARPITRSTRADPGARSRRDVTAATTPAGDRGAAAGTPPVNALVAACWTSALVSAKRAVLIGAKPRTNPRTVV